jgi:cellulose biosynthesis protein BcsQ
LTGDEANYLVQVRPHNQNIPENVWLLAGDPSLELQSQVINQIGGQALPADAWKNVHNWLRDLVGEGMKKLGADFTTVFIDCNPSFSSYTELSMLAADQVIVPCSSDGSSARAINNVGSLLYGITSGNDYGTASFPAKVKSYGMHLPKIRVVLLSRSTQYKKTASTAFRAMFEEIKKRANDLKDKAPEHFVDGDLRFGDMPDSHSVAIVCSHLGLPLYSVAPGQYHVHESTPQVNPEPLDRYKAAVKELIDTL